MLIGQTFHIFTPEERRARLGGFTDLPPNLKRAEEHEFWRIVAAERYDVEHRQPLVRKFFWEKSRSLWPYDASQGSLGCTLPNVRLFIRPDLSGILVVFDHEHVVAPNDPINGIYRPYFFSFAACRHMTITRSSSAVASGERVVCAECGFWTQVTSD